MNASPDWPRNRLLLALPSRNLKRLMPELEQIRCQRAQILMNADSSLDHVFFPDSGVVSVVAVYADGSIIEMATIGREGCSGVQAILGAKRSSVQLLVQLPGRPGIRYFRRFCRWPLVDFHSVIQELMWTTIARMFHFSLLPATYLE
jgi:hypothetical protein